MDFKESLSKIAKSFSDGAVNAAKKSGDIVEITKINMTISTQEDKLKDIYAKIGEKVYNKHFEDNFAGDDLKDLFEKISSINDYIKYLNKKINEINNIIICQNCGSEVNINVAFCPKCGNKMNVDESNDCLLTDIYDVTPEDVSTKNTITEEK